MSRVRGSHASEPSHVPPPVVGPEHPLAKAEARVRTLRGQAAAVGAVIGASAVGALAGVAQLVAVVASAAMVQVLLLVLLAAATATRRDRAVELIAGGRSSLPLEVVRRERARLTDPRRVRALASSLDTLRRDADRCPWRAPSIYVPSTIMAVDAEIARTVAALRDGRPGPVAMARAERLLGGPASPLYGDDVRALREALHRIRFAARLR